MTRPFRPEDAPYLELLAARSPSESVPLLLEVARRQVSRKRPRDLMAQLERDGFVAPSALDLRLAHRLDGLALQAAADFEAILLSPLAPLGTCAVVSPTDQNRIVSTVRGTEVVSDPTNVMALECARRLGKAGSARVRLCTLHQVVRAQRFESRPGFSQHFRLFALAEAGAALPAHGFEVDAVVAHVALFWKLFDLCETLGCRFPNRKATLFIGPGAQPIAHRVRNRFQQDLPDLRIDEASLESHYYDGIRVLFGADSTSGAHVPIADTGVFDWMAKLTSNRRHRLVASGLGLQLVPLLFREPG